jgi:thiamine biosynthesis lipoprotein
MKRYQQIEYKLGSEAVITLVAHPMVKIDSLFLEIWQYVDDFEQRFSRFRPDSELSLFNAQSGHNVKVSPEFTKLLQETKYYSKLTGGIFNPFILPSLQQAGYVGSWPEPDIYDSKLDLRGRKIANAEMINLKNDLAMIPYETALDFGGIGKGYLLNSLSHILDKKQIHNYWLSLGGDVICNGKDVDGKAWEIEIAKASDNKMTLAVVTNEKVGKIAIATSGVTKRRGKNWHHIIDPRTGGSANTNILSVTVVCSSAIAADVYAKSILIDSFIEFAKSKSSKRILGKALQYTDGSYMIDQKEGMIHAS